MNNLLLSNIKESFRIIAEEKPRVPEHLIKIIDERNKHFFMKNFGGEKISISEISEAHAKFPIRALPWFYWDSKSELKSPQQSFFGFYLLRNALRGIFISLSFLQSGGLLQKKHLLAVSTFSFYTALFHLLHSFLALYGRVVIEPVLGPIKIIYRKESSECTHDSLNPYIEVIIALLTKKNEWKFEKRTRSHSKRWKELDPILTKQGNNIPSFFISFFKYVTAYGGVYLSNKHNLVKDGIEQLTEIRHESIYQGYGYDDMSHDMLINREQYATFHIDLKSNSYRDFAISLLKYCISQVFYIKSNINIKHWNKTRIHLYGSVTTPPFEHGNFDILGKTILKKDLDLIWSWLTKDQ